MVARATQGIGAAIASATALSLIVALFPEGQERNRALSFYATVSSGAFAAGVILGGLLTSTLGWRSVLFVNVPIGTIAAVRQMARAPNGGLHIIVEGLTRAKADIVTKSGSSLRATVYPIPEPAERTGQLMPAKRAAPMLRVGSDLTIRLSRFWQPGAALQNGAAAAS